MNTKLIIVAIFTQMRKHMKLIRVSTVWIACGFLILAVWSATALAQTPPSDMPPKPGNPIVDLQQQINALEQRVSELEGAPPAPQEFSVNCTEGDKIADVLAQVAYTKGPVTITISGVCQESLTIYRDNITLRGASPATGLTPASSEWFILNLIGARRTRIENLALTGGSTGLNAASGATFEASGLHVKDANNTGVHLRSEASGTLSNSIIENCGTGIATEGSGTLYVNGGEVKNSYVGVAAAGKSYISLGGGFKVTGSSGHAVFARGGFIEIQNAIIEDNLRAGAWAMGGGSISIVGSNTFIRRNKLGVVAEASSVSLRDGVQVTDNDGWAGIQSRFGGHVDLEVGVMVTDNHGAGIVVSGNSSAQVSGSSIQRNTYDGIQVYDSSVVTFQGEPNVITNNGSYGINCYQTPPSVAQSWGNPGTILPNGWGGTNCPGYP